MTGQRGPPGHDTETGYGRRKAREHEALDPGHFLSMGHAL